MVPVELGDMGNQNVICFNLFWWGNYEEKQSHTGEAVDLVGAHQICHIMKKKHGG
jgi:hypothetical protein